VGLSDWRSTPSSRVIVSVGLAGGLGSDARPGTVVVATEVAYGDQSFVCDERWSRALVNAARRLALPVLHAPLVTTGAMVTGAQRAAYARAGFAAVDMETGMLARDGVRIAAVRTLLDTPQRELSPRWRHPMHAMLDPRCWSEAMWLMRHAPLYARRAAMVLASALAEGDVDPEI